MKENLLSIDNEFTEHYRSLFEIQEKVKLKLDVYAFDLTKTEISDTIISRMSVFWYFNVQNNKTILERYSNSTAADFFTETYLIFLSFTLRVDTMLRCIQKKLLSKVKV